MRSSILALALAALCAAVTSARAWDESKYPDWAGEWRNALGPPTKWDITKPVGRGQQAPLTPEYQALFEANLADQAAGGQGLDPTYTCIPDGMPRAMNVVFPMEIVITPKVTYMIIEYLSMLRRIYTDSRDWPKDADPAFMGYSIGRWVDEDGSGRYNLLEIETRNLKGPRIVEPSGIPLDEDKDGRYDTLTIETRGISGPRLVDANIPLHENDSTVVKERISLDKSNPDVLYDEITTTDHALTRPWTVTKKYLRNRNPRWVEAVCMESNPHLRIGKENYMMSADGYLMPAKKNQPAPDLRYFNQTRK